MFLLFIAGLVGMSMGMSPDGCRDPDHLPFAYRTLMQRCQFAPSMPYRRYTKQYIDDKLREELRRVHTSVKAHWDEGQCPRARCAIALAIVETMCREDERVAESLDALSALSHDGICEALEGIGGAFSGPREVLAVLDPIVTQVSTHKHHQECHEKMMYTLEMLKVYYREPWFHEAESLIGFMRSQLKLDSSGRLSPCEADRCRAGMKLILVFSWLGVSAPARWKFAKQVFLQLASPDACVAANDLSGLSEENEDAKATFARMEERFEISETQTWGQWATSTLGAVVDKIGF